MVLLLKAMDFIWVVEMTKLREEGDLNREAVFVVEWLPALS